MAPDMGQEADRTTRPPGRQVAWFPIEGARDQGEPSQGASSSLAHHSPRHLTVSAPRQRRPPVLGGFSLFACLGLVTSFKHDIDFQSANLDFSAEPGLQRLVRRHKIAESIIVREDGERFGIIGATTESLSIISSPRNVIINEVLPAVQREVQELKRRGIDKIILISPLNFLAGPGKSPRPPIRTRSTPGYSDRLTTTKKHRDRLIGDPGVVLPGVVSEFSGQSWSAPL